MLFMRVRNVHRDGGDARVPQRPYPIHAYRHGADEGGNESLGGTEVNYQINVQPAPAHLIP